MQILVLKEKHGEAYFAAPKGGEGSVMLRIIWARNEEGWYEGSMDLTEELLLKEVLDGDLKAAVKFFRLRKDGEYEGWDLVTPKEVEPEEHMPSGCRAIYEEIERRALKLSRTFMNGNRKDMLRALEGMETKVALAVLAEIMFLLGGEGRNKVQNFLKEMA